MALNEKLYEETGKVPAFKSHIVHPVEGTTREVSFALLQR